MPATTFRITAFAGPAGGISGARYVAVAGIAKAATAGVPAQVANELIVGNLGRGLRLPIPPGFVARSEGDDAPYHVSLNFALTGEVLPPADTEAVAEHAPTLACGVILFDVWVANDDRHNRNLAWDEDTKTLQLFDHGLAFLRDETGAAGLRNVDNGSLVRAHCLTPEIRSIEGFEAWNARIAELPESYIAGTVADAVGFGLGADDVGPCTDFLIGRRKSLMDIVRAHKDRFEKAGGMFL